MQKSVSAKERGVNECQLQACSSGDRCPQYLIYSRIMLAVHHPRRDVCASDPAISVLGLAGTGDSASTFL